jgi:hypothetical protein
VKRLAALPIAPHPKRRGIAGVREVDDFGLQDRNSNSR